MQTKNNHSQDFLSEMIHETYFYGYLGRFINEWKQRDYKLIIKNIRNYEKGNNIREIEIVNTHDETVKLIIKCDKNDGCKILDYAISDNIENDESIIKTINAMKNLKKEDINEKDVDDILYILQGIVGDF